MRCDAMRCAAMRCACVRGCGCGCGLRCMRGLLCSALALLLALFLARDYEGVFALTTACVRLRKCACGSLRTSSLRPQRRGFCFRTCVHVVCVWRVACVATCR
jgi:hypothetical protein